MKKVILKKVIQVSTVLIVLKLFFVIVLNEGITLKYKDRIKWASPISKIQLNVKKSISSFAYKFIWGSAAKGNSVIEIGGTYLLTGICLDENSKKMKIFEDQVSVQSISGDLVSGIVRSSYEAVNCNLSKIDTIPIGPDQLIPVNKAVKSSLFKLKNEIITVTGICKIGEKRELLNEEVFDVFDVYSDEKGRTVLKGIMRRLGHQAICIDKHFRYTIIDPSSARNILESKSSPKKEKTPMANQVLVTGKCFNTAKDDKGNSLTKTFNLLNATIDVIQIKRVGSHIEFVNGMIKSGKKVVAITCDPQKYDVKLMDYRRP